MNQSDFSNLTNIVVTPTEKETILAQESSQFLLSHLNTESSQNLKIISDQGENLTVKVPASAFRLFINILTEMAQGNSVTLMPIHAELTTLQAAEILNVSRTDLIKLLESGEISFRKVGNHRRILYQDLREYQNKINAKRRETLAELATQAQALNMGY